MKSAAEINAERIAAIIREMREHVTLYSAADIARKIVEAFDVLRPHQQSMDEHGRTRPIPAPLPWANK